LTRGQRPLCPPGRIGRQLRCRFEEGGCGGEPADRDCPVSRSFEFDGYSFIGANRGTGAVPRPEVWVDVGVR
jgi:hypothetical protein